MAGAVFEAQQQADLGVDLPVEPLQARDKLLPFAVERLEFGPLAVLRLLDLQFLPALGELLFQTLINAALRSHIERAEEPIEKILRRVIREEIRLGQLSGSSRVASGLRSLAPATRGAKRI
ncbi:MAG: hypothetical protein ACRD3D_03460 [Terriglobia bacterium]